MAKYSYAVIGRAIACKIMECEKSSEKWEFVDDVSDWAENFAEWEPER